MWSLKLPGDIWIWSSNQGPYRHSQAFKWTRLLSFREVIIFLHYFCFVFCKWQKGLATPRAACLLLANGSWCPYAHCLATTWKATLWELQVLHPTSTHEWKLHTTSWTISGCEFDKEQQHSPATSYLCCVSCQTSKRNTSKGVLLLPSQVYWDITHIFNSSI